MVILNKRYEAEIDLLLDVYDGRLEDMFDELDITLPEVLTILLERGYIVLPPYIEKDKYR